ncbi:MAG: PAS domain-containing protein, partial [Bacteroidota bacterium]
MKGSPTSIAEYFDHSKEYLYSFADKDFRLVKANSLFLKKFQLHSEDYVGKPFQDVIQQIESKKIVQAGKFCLQEPGTTVKIEVEITSASGEENWFQWEISSLHCNNDEESGVQIIGIDITEKKRSERQLLYQAVLLDNISDAVISTDKWFRLKSLNKAAEKIFHVKASDAAGVPLTEFFDNEAPSSFNNIISTLQKIGYWNGELKLKKSADQKESYQSFSITSVKDNQDVIIGYLAINRGYYRNPANKKMSVSPNNINNFEEHFTTN